MKKLIKEAQDLYSTAIKCILDHFTKDQSAILNLQFPFTYAVQPELFLTGLLLNSATSPVQSQGNVQLGQCVIVQRIHSEQVDVLIMFLHSLLHTLSRHYPSPVPKGVFPVDQNVLCGASMKWRPDSSDVHM